MQGPFTGLSWRVLTLERISTYLLRDQHIVGQARSILAGLLAERLIRPCDQRYTESPMKTDTATRSDLDAFTALNGDYIHSVQHGDVQRFDEILAEDFLCSNPTGHSWKKANSSRRPLDR